MDSEPMDRDQAAVRTLLAADDQSAALALLDACRPRTYRPGVAVQDFAGVSRTAVTVHLEAPADLILDSGVEARCAIADAYCEVLREHLAVTGVEFFVPGADAFTVAGVPSPPAVP